MFLTLSSARRLLLARRARRPSRSRFCRPSIDGSSVCADQALMTCTYTVVSRINDGSAHSSLFADLTVSALTGLQKPDNGGIRPIAIGDALARLSSRCILAAPCRTRSRSTSRRLCLLPPQGAAVRSSWVLASLAAPSTGSFFLFHISFLYSQLYQKRHLDQSVNAIMRRLTGYAVPPQDDRPASARLDEPLMACSQAKSSAQAKAFITCWQGPK